jgi:rubrerythrin
METKPIIKGEPSNTRRKFLTRTLGGGAVALAFMASPVGLRKAKANSTGSDIEILNYALTLEHLEYAFYRDGLQRFKPKDFRAVAADQCDAEDNGRSKGHDRDGNGKGTQRGADQIFDYLKLIRDHEKAHVDTLTSVIVSLGGTPVPELRYDFGYHDARGFLEVAQALENTGVMAYDGAIALICNPDLQTAGATIATVEARHASYLNLINGDVPFPDAFDQPKTMAEILAIAGQFIVS